MSKRISRRAVLKGLGGVTLGLPLLEAMLPRTPAAGPRPPLRLAYFYVPMGVNQNAWAPKLEGARFELSPTLEPLQKVKDRLLVLTGLDHRRDDPAGNPHPRGSSTFLSSARVGKLDSAGFCTDISVDQLAAKHIGPATRLPSLELAGVASLAKHAANISWRKPGAPMGQTVKPRHLYRRLFGDPKGDSCRRALLDKVRQDARKLHAGLGRSDQGKLEEYLDGIRSIERQLEVMERERKQRGAPAIQLPEVAPTDYRANLRLLLDLLVSAFQTDVTRVASMMFALENGAGPVSFRFLDIPEDHHGLTHFNDGNKEAALKKLAKIDRFYVEQFAYFLKKLQSIPEGESTLLDNSLVLYGSGISWGNRHNWDNVPILLAGGGGGTVTGGRHIRYPAGTPLANLHLSMLDRVGVKLERIADSTGRLPKLTV